MPLVLTFLILIAVFIIIVLSTIKFEIVDFELSNIIPITPKNYKIKLYEGDKNKLFVRKSPEVIVEIEDIELIDKTLEFYSNAVFEGRYLYFFKKENKQEVEKIIENYKYHDHNLFAFLDDKVDCLIENLRECEDSSSYSIIIKKTYLKNIKIINSHLNL